VHSTGYSSTLSCMIRLIEGLRYVENFLLPPRCAFCRWPTVKGESGVCQPCREDLPRNAPCCPRCALPLAADPGVVDCASCQAAPPPFRRTLAPLRYEFPVDAAIRALKFRRRLDFVPVLSTIMQDCFVESGLTPDLVVPVPLHYRRHGWRGFNQAERIAKPMAKAAGLPLLLTAERVRATKTQSGLDARRRRGNLAGAFRVDLPPGTRHVLIVDDVMTTGATVVEFARTIRKNNRVEKVSVLVAARR